MISRRTRAGRLAALALVPALASSFAAEARAGFAFGYGATVTASPASPAAAVGPTYAASSTVEIGAGNSLTFTTTSSGSADINASLLGGADVNFGYIAFNPGGSTSAVAYNVHFDYAVMVADAASHDSAVVHFSGQLAGHARGSVNAINGAFFNFAVDPTSARLGDGLYSFGFKTSTSPGTGQRGVLQGNVAAFAAPVPEPAAIVLVSLGGLGLLALGRIRRRAAG